MNSLGLLETLRAHISSLKGLKTADIFLRRSRQLRIRASTGQGVEFTRSEGLEAQVRLSKNDQTGALWLVPDDSEAYLSQIQSVYKDLDKIPGNSHSIQMGRVFLKSESKNFSDSGIEDVPLEEKVQRTWNLRESLKSQLSEPDASLSTACYFERQQEIFVWQMGIPKALSRKSSEVLVEAKASIKNKENLLTSKATAHEGHYLDLDWTRVGKESIQNLVELKDPRSLESMQCPVLFSPHVGVKILGEFFKSWTRKPPELASGLKLSKEITLFDDPHVNKKVGSTLWDDEGTPTQRTLLIERGEVCALPATLRQLTSHPLYVGGFARRLWGQHAPLIGYHNLNLEPGIRDRVDLEKNISRGLRVSGAQFVKSSQGKGFWIFSGSWWEAGKFSYAVAPMVCSLSPEQLLARVVGVGRDQTVRGRLACPSLLCDNVPLVGVE